MKKLIVAAVAALCIVSLGFGQSVDFDKLRKIDDVWFRDGKPYTGRIASECVECSEKYSGNMVSGKKHGEWRYSDASYSESGNYKDGKEQGEWVYWWESGSSSRGNYKDGEKHGKWTTSNQTGSVTKEEYYENGVKVK